MPGRTVVALSGGVDSAVAAALTVEAGAEAIGMTLRLYDAPLLPGKRRHGSCCAPEDIDDARRVADQLEIPFYVLEASERFRRDVIDPFVDSYRAGRTPLPCAACNRNLKFGHLLDRAQALSARLCTGHYARIDRRPDGSFRLLRARDERRDQSYFLFGLRQEDLAHLDFPLGERLKSEVRTMAAERGLRVATKPDSQELCFLPGDYAEYVEAHGGPGLPGEMRDLVGSKLGEHSGVHRFTIGQRHGLPIVTGPAPRYVTRIDAASGTVEVGAAEDLLSERLEVRETSYPGGNRRSPFEALVRIRHQHAGALATVIPGKGARAEVRFREPVRAPAPGQAAVFYDGPETVGGGLIV
jgi:tRNA-specific 2-thiouridylase